MTVQSLNQELIFALNDAIIKVLREQGHENTGKLANSVNGRISLIDRGFHIRGFSLYYAHILDSGVTADRIPFELTGNGGTSQYIKGLQTYFQSKGLGAKEALRAAFATAMVHKKEGMSTNASNRFSKTGFRKNFIAVVEKRYLPIIKERYLRDFDRIFQKEFHKIKSEII